MVSNNGTPDTEWTPPRLKKDVMDLAFDYRTAKLEVQRAEYRLGQRRKELEKLRRAIVRMMLAESRAAAEAKLKITL